MMKILDGHCYKFSCSKETGREKKYAFKHRSLQRVLDAAKEEVL
jgi:hypothetical protein